MNKDYTFIVIGMVISVTVMLISVFVCDNFRELLMAVFCVMVLDLLCFVAHKVVNRWVKQSIQNYTCVIVQLN